MALPASDEIVMRNESEPHRGPQTAAILPSFLDLEKPHTDPPTSWHKSFALLRLHPELRCMVYREAIAAGSTGILRTSHFVQQEALPLLYKAGILRIRTQSYGPHFHFVEVPPASFRPWSNSIQNIEISVRIAVVPDPVDDREPPDMGCIATFTDGAAAVQRDTCYITFKKDMSSMLHQRPTVLLDAIRKLRGFKRIIVTAIASDGAGDMGAQRAIVRARNKTVYAMALEKLEPVFGPGVWHDAAVQESRYLEFRPKQG